VKSICTSNTKKKFTSIDFSSFPLEYSGVPASAKHHQLQPHLHRKPLIYQPANHSSLSLTTSLRHSALFQSESTLLLQQEPAYIDSLSSLKSFHSLPPLHSLGRCCDSAQSLNHSPTTHYCPAWMSTRSSRALSRLVSLFCLNTSSLKRQAQPLTS
jgi:hypothetical protein